MLGISHFGPARKKVFFSSFACVASVSVQFRSKRETFFARSLTLAPRSLLLNRKETLATQTRHRINPLFPSSFGENRLKDSIFFPFRVFIDLDFVLVQLKRKKDLGQ